LSNIDISNNIDNKKSNIDKDKSNIDKSKLSNIDISNNIDNKKFNNDIYNVENIKEKNTGSTLFQIFFFTKRIHNISNHLKKNKKDFNSERSLIKIVVKRKKLLLYIKKNNKILYKKILKVLKIKK
uniref:30S ribosomal protein S15 n=1 Tax=Candidatus Shikimatogenerans silvanidophilus TaxID=2782547 RepID=UPI001BB4525F